MNRMFEPVDPLATLAESVDRLAAQTEDARRDLDNATRAGGARTAALEGRTRVLRLLLAAVAAAAVCATGGAVYALVDVRAAQDDLRVNTRSDCAYHRDLADLPAALAAAAATRTPRPTVPPTLSPFTARLVADSARAYELAGCADDLGPLPTHTPEAP